MNQQPMELYQQGAFSQQQQQQQQQQQRQAIPQPMRLVNPTNFHLEATRLRNNQKQISSDGAPPTPNNSFQSNNTLSNTINTIDPQILSMSQFQQPYKQQFMNHPIKHESEINQVDVDFDQPTMSPLSNSSSGSPPNHSFENDVFGRSFKPASHLDNLPPSFSGGSPSNTSMFSPIDTVDYSYTEDFPMSAPTTSAIGPMDVKTNVNNNNNNNTKLFRHPHNNLSQLSMSMPVLTSSGTEWYSSSLDHSSSLQFSSTGADMQLVTTNFMEPEDNDTQKQAMLFEKRRRRRESHNAVERRRRDNINEKIQELSTLLPDLYVDSSNKPNKGVILRKSVDYIRQLKSMIEQEKNRNSKLETQVRELSSKSGMPIDNNSSSASSRSDLNNLSDNLSGGGHFG